MKLQEEYDKIYSFLKTTSEPFDELDWDGETLDVILNNQINERYTRKDITKWKILN
jgi:hypothetical protein